MTLRQKGVPMGLCNCGRFTHGGSLPQSLSCFSRSRGKTKEIQHLSAPGQSSDVCNHLLHSQVCCIQENGILTAQEIDKQTQEVKVSEAGEMAQL